MTIQGAMNELVNLLGVDDIPVYYKGVIVKVIETIDDEVQAGRKKGEWNISDYKSVCSVCGADETDFIYGTEIWYGLGESKFCPNCGSKMGKGVSDDATLKQNITSILECHFSGFKDELIEACVQRIMEQIERQADIPQAEREGE